MAIGETAFIPPDWRGDEFLTVRTAIARLEAEIWLTRKARRR